MTEHIKSEEHRDGEPTKRSLLPHNKTLFRSPMKEASRVARFIFWCLEQGRKALCGSLCSIEEATQSAELA